MTLVYPVNTVQTYKNVLLIDLSSVPDYQVFYDSANADTFPIIYSNTSTKINLLEVLNTKFTTIEKIALVFIVQDEPNILFLDSKPFFDISSNLSDSGDIISRFTTSNENTTFLLNVINNFQVTIIDFLACNTLQYKFWYEYYYKYFNGILVGASSDRTGDLYRSNEFIDNMRIAPPKISSQDIETIYFTQSIEYSTYLLNTFNYILPLIETNFTGSARDDNYIDYFDNISVYAFGVVILPIFRLKYESAFSAIDRLSISDNVLVSLQGETTCRGGSTRFVIIYNPPPVIGTHLFKFYFKNLANRWGNEYISPIVTVNITILPDPLPPPKPLPIKLPDGLVTSSYSPVTLVNNLGLIPELQRDFFTIVLTPPPLLSIPNSNLDTSSTIGNSSGLPLINDYPVQLPAGLELNVTTDFNISTVNVTISGTPNNPGTYTFFLMHETMNQISDNAFLHRFTYTEYSLIIHPLFTLLPDAGPLPKGIIGSEYNQALTASGGFGGPYTYTITLESLPDGLNLTASSGLISGTPLFLKSYTFSVTVTDVNNNFITHEYTIDVTTLSANICFPTGTPIQTDQGVISIDQLQPKIHTIRGKPIVAITKTVTEEKYLVCLEKDALGKNVPNQKTKISANHEIFYKGKMWKAKYLVDVCSEKVRKIKYKGETLYNVLLAEHDKMVVNNLICETLDPKSVVAQIYTKLNYEHCDIVTKIEIGDRLQKYYKNRRINSEIYKN
jgi:hypothetical protein